MPPRRLNGCIKLSRRAGNALSKRSESSQIDQKVFELFGDFIPSGACQIVPDRYSRNSRSGQLKVLTKGGYEPTVRVRGFVVGCWARKA
jgi:hypothetical protein